MAVEGVRLDEYKLPGLHLNELSVSSGEWLEGYDNIVLATVVLLCRIWVSR